MMDEKDVPEKSGSEEDDLDDVAAESAFYSESAGAAKAERERRLADAELRKASRAMVVPTADRDVRTALRARGEPQCLFGEDAYDRRERLRSIMVTESVQERAEADSKQMPPPKEPEKPRVEPEPEEFFTEGSEALKRTRQALLIPSLKRAQVRLVESRKRQRSAEWREEANALYTAMQKLAAVSSQIGDTRPLSACAFSAQHQTSPLCPPYVATGSWTGLVRVWDVQTSSELRNLDGHTERVSAVVFHPANVEVLATSGADRVVRLWNLGNEKGKEQVHVLSGHADRVAGINFHPLGTLLATAGYDTSWRLWDVETGQELLLQEGHSKPVYKVAYHPDGSLVASGGLDRATRIWDTRSGRCVMTFTGHVDSVLGVDFCPDGYHLATGSGDNSIKIWDLRKRRCFYTISAHSSCVSNVRYQPERGHLLVSSSFDRSTKIWSRRGYVLVGALTSHEEKVTCTDISTDGETIVTTCYDKTWKLWSAKDQL
mmetsp:Transcript_4364/g.13211  ORF Transcript_4364/g.13211 Transcript_4364/m.13211 type:complete len:488 (-) Transcript_4364:1983-3446(-)